MVESNSVIRIGENYQADLPANSILADATNDTSPPKKGNIWSSKNSLTDEEMDEFFIRANKIINDAKYGKLLDYQKSSPNAADNPEANPPLVVDGSWVAVNCDLKDLLHQLLNSW